MTDFLMISPLCDSELDAVTGGSLIPILCIRQNAKGRDIIVSGANGVSVATSGVGGAARSGGGGAGGTNTITSHP